MLIPFYLAASVAVLATLMVITRKEPVHALLYLVVSLLASAVVFYILGAPFVAALEVITYAGAIMVLFIFVVMLLNLGRRTWEREAAWMRPRVWAGPAVLAVLLGLELVGLVAGGGPATAGGTYVGPKAVGTELFGPYVLGVEIASFLLLAGLVGAYHLGRREEEREGEDS